jgi:hypothetical protein
VANALQTVSDLTAPSQAQTQAAANAALSGASSNVKAAYAANVSQAEQQGASDAAAAASTLISAGGFKNTQADADALVYIVAGAMSCFPPVGTAVGGALATAYKIGEAAVGPMNQVLDNLGFAQNLPEGRSDGRQWTTQMVLDQWGFNPATATAFAKVAVPLFAKEAATAANGTTSAPTKPVVNPLLLPVLIGWWNKNNPSSPVATYVPDTFAHDWTTDPDEESIIADQPTSLFGATLTWQEQLSNAFRPQSSLPASFPAGKLYLNICPSPPNVQPIPPLAKFFGFVGASPSPGKPPMAILQNSGMGYGSAPALTVVPLTISLPPAAGLTAIAQAAAQNTSAAVTRATAPVKAAATKAASGTILGLPTADVVIGGVGAVGLLWFAKARHWL